MTEKISDILPIEGKENGPEDDLSLESLVLLINTDRLKYLKDKTAEEFRTLQERQEKVRELHKLLKQINASTSDKGELDLSKNSELLEFLKKAKNHGIPCDGDKKKYNKDDRDRLVENIKMSIEDYNVQNDMQLQTISRLTNERYETYQMARSILKPLHEDKQNKARAMAGR
jgi:hypothetical protein